MFFLYQFYIHNLAFEGLDSKMAEPREEFCWENVTLIDPDLSEFKSDYIDDLAEKIENLDLNPLFTCETCGAGYTKEGFLRRHMEAKPGKQLAQKKVGPVCSECDKVFANKYKLEQHMKTHMKCTTCKKEFESIEDVKIHKKEHTFCKVCKKDFYFVSKLAKHMSSMHK